MGCSKACRRVSWAPDEKISQIRLYNPQSSPLQCGTKSYNGAQPESNNIKNQTAPRNDFSPGFQKSQTPIIQWSCPPKFEVADEWRVAFGQQSEEIGVQNLRTRQEAEALYPHPLFVPPNPLFPVETDLRSISDEGETPVISLIPIEERDPAPSVADLDLLRKILSNPKMIGELFNLQNLLQRNGSSSVPCFAAPVRNSVSVSTENGSMKLFIPSMEDAVVEKYLLRNAVAGSSSSNGSQFREANWIFNRAAENGSSSSSIPGSMPYPAVTPNGSSVNSTATATTTAAVCIPSPISTAMPRNVSVFSSSIKKGKKVKNIKGKKRKVKNKAVCFYFNSAKGCRRGQKCEFFHDEAQKKRKKNNTQEEDEEALRVS